MRKSKGKTGERASPGVGDYAKNGPSKETVGKAN